MCLRPSCQTRPDHVYRPGKGDQRRSGSEIHQPGFWSIQSSWSGKMTDAGSTRKSGNKMWGGRFSAGPDAVMEAINASIDFDRKLYAQDIAGFKGACAIMLARQNIISEADAASILEGLDRVRAEIEGGSFAFRKSLEDIHMNVEARLAE